VKELTRTGQSFDFRRCPKHDLPLELCVDDTDFSTWSEGHQLPYNHHENRVGWRCDACLGGWYENHFIAQRPSRPHTRLILACPACGSRRVDHQCVAGCCGRHACGDCGADLESAVQLIAPGDRARDLPPGGPTSSGGITAFEGVQRTGLHRSWRRCSRHPDTALELSIVQRMGGRYDTGWVCEQCSRVWLEEGFHVRRLRFGAEVEADALCPQCQCGPLDSIDGEPGRCVCWSCGALVEVTLEIVTNPPRG